MLNLVKPRYVMPFHGDFKRLRLHAPAGRGGRASTPDDIFQGENGLPLEIDERGARFGEPEQAGMIFVDGVEIGDVGRRRAARPPHALRRRHLHRRRDDLRAGRRARSPTPEVIFRGVPFLDEADELIEEIRERRRATRSRAPPRSEIREIDLLQQDAARRPRGVRLRPPQAPADGAAGRRRGLISACRRQRRRSAARRPPPARDRLSGPVERDPRSRTRAGAVGWRACRRRGITKRAPGDGLPAGLARATTVPPCDSATALTIARPRPEPPPRSPPPRTKRSNSALAQLRRDAGAVVLDDRARRVAVARSTRRVIVRARAACGAARSRSG